MYHGVGKLIGTLHKGKSYGFTLDNPEHQDTLLKSIRENYDILDGVGDSQILFLDCRPIDDPCKDITLRDRVGTNEGNVKHMASTSSRVMAQIGSTPVAATAKSVGGARAKPLSGSALKLRPRKGWSAHKIISWRHRGTDVQAPTGPGKAPPRVTLTGAPPTPCKDLGVAFSTGLDFAVRGTAAVFKADDDVGEEAFLRPTPKVSAQVPAKSWPAKSVIAAGATSKKMEKVAEKDNEKKDDDPNTGTSPMKVEEKEGERKG